MASTMHKENTKLLRRVSTKHDLSTVFLLYKFLTVFSLTISVLMFLLIYMIMVGYLLYVQREIKNVKRSHTYQTVYSKSRNRGEPSGGQKHTAR